MESAGRQCVRDEQGIEAFGEEAFVSFLKGCG